MARDSRAAESSALVLCTAAAYACFEEAALHNGKVPSFQRGAASVLVKGRQPWRSDLGKPNSVVRYHIAPVLRQGCGGAVLAVTLRSHNRRSYGGAMSPAPTSPHAAAARLSYLPRLDLPGRGLCPNGSDVCSGNVNGISEDSCISASNLPDWTW